MFDRIYAGVLAKIKEAGGVKAMLYSWGFRRKAYFLGQGARCNEVRGGTSTWILKCNMALSIVVKGDLSCWGVACTTCLCKLCFWRDTWEKWQSYTQEAWARARHV